MTPAATPDAPLTVAEALGEPVPASESEATAHPPAKAVGRWITRVKYDPDDGLRAADYEVPAPEYQRRFAVLEADELPTTNLDKYLVHIPGMKPEHAFVPMDVRGIFLDPVAKSRRWRPQRIESKRELKAFHASPSGRRKLLVESESAGLGGGDVFDTSDRGGGQDAMRLMDTEFIPLTGGPMGKQLYLSDYLLMNARSFELVNHSAIAAAAIKILTRFTLGRGISFHIQHPKARAIWEAFWERNRMRDKIRMMARDLPWQGELMLRYYEHVQGQVDLRVLDPSSCWEVVTEPDDLERCLHGSTKIALLDGTAPTVEELSRRKITADAPVWTYSYDGATGHIVPGKITKCWRQPKKKRCVAVLLDNGERIVASYDHPFLLRGGAYRNAELLKPGDSLMPLYRREHQGRERLWQPNVGPRGRWVSTHRWVYSVAKNHGAMNTFPWSVHHINGRMTDNSPENLELIHQGRHLAGHVKESWKDSAFAKKAMARLNSPEALQKKSAIFKRLWADPEWAAMMRAASRSAHRTPEARKRIGDAARRRWKDAKKKKAACAAMTEAWRSGPGRAERVRAIQASWTPERRRKHSEKTAAWWRERKATTGAVSAPSNHKIVAIEDAGVHTVYDLQVDGHHNFALAAGVFTHNTLYFHFQYMTPTQLYAVGPVPSARYIVVQIPPTNIQHVKINCSSTEKRGRSDFLPAMPWFKRLNDYYNGVTVKALLEANLVWKVKIKGEMSDLQNFSTDPSLTELPPPGGIWLENEQVNLEPMTASMTATRASSGIGGELVALIAASLNLPLEYFNMTGGAAAARATALVRTDPAVKMIEDRQQILRETLEEIYVRQMALALARGHISREDAREEPEARPDPEQAPDRHADPEDWMAARHADGIRARLAKVRG